MKQLFALGILILSFIFQGLGVSLAQETRVMGHQIPPFSMYGNDKVVTGFSADLFKLAFKGEKDIPHDIKIAAVTFNRLYIELQRDVRRIGLTVGRNAEREHMFKWVGPYLTLDLGVIARKDRNFKINSLKDFNGFQIATIENTAPEQALLNMGVPMELFNRDLYPRRNIMKIANGRVEFMAFPLQGLSYLMVQNGVAPSDYEEVFPISSIDVYFAFSKDFADEEIAYYQARLDDVLKSPAFAELKEKYAMDGILRYKKG